MENETLTRPDALSEISDTDWERTPESKRLVRQLIERIASLEERQAHLEEQLKQNARISVGV